MRRTITDARRTFERDLLPAMSDYQAGEARQVLEAAEARAREHAEAYVTERETQVIETRTEALRELTETRDALDDLVREGGEGRTSSAEYATRLRELRERQVQAEGYLREAQAEVDHIEQIEADPVAFYDDLAQRLPRLQDDWPW